MITEWIKTSHYHNNLFWYNLINRVRIFIKTNNHFIPFLHGLHHILSCGYPSKVNLIPCKSKATALPRHIDNHRDWRCLLCALYCISWKNYLDCIRSETTSDWYLPDNRWNLMSFLNTLQKYWIRYFLFIRMEEIFEE